MKKIEQFENEVCNMRSTIQKKIKFKMTIGRKLIGSFLIIALLLGVTGSIASIYLKKIDTIYTDLVDRRTIILSNVLKTQVEISKENSLIRAYMITRDAEFLDKLEKAYEDSSQLIHDTLKISQIPSFKESLQELDKGNQEFKEKYDELIQMIQSKKSSDQVLDYFIAEVFPRGIELDPMAENLANEQLNAMKEASEQSTLLVNNAVTNVAVVSIFAFVFAVLFGYICSRMLSRPIVTIAKAVEEIALGNLTVEDIKLKNKDEIGVLAHSFNQMKDNLQRLVHEIRISSEHVASSSEELTASSEQSSKASEAITMTIQEVSTNAEMQSRNIDDSLQAIHEMSSGVQQIASNAQMTSSLTIETAQKALEGNQSIQSTVSQMDSIQNTMHHLAKAVTEMQEQSKEIEMIVDVITEIAAQTNLLSLNAAIEAARAGEQGRGFAVVAGEVRKLAEQSSQSAGQIAELVTTINHRTFQLVEKTEAGVREVSDGIQVAHSAGQLFEFIKKDIDEVSNQIQEISTASQQISMNTEQVVDAIGFISEGSKTVAAESQNLAASTQEQLASMEEITSSATSLSNMSEELRNLIEKFKI